MKHRDIESNLCEDVDDNTSVGVLSKAFPLSAFWALLISDEVGRNGKPAQGN
jgi:hypothetical protein